MSFVHCWISSEEKQTGNYFVDFIQDLSHSDINRLRHLNAILLMELTKNFSDIEKFKYLNEILLIQFKNAILGMQFFT